MLFWYWFGIPKLYYYKYNPDDIKNYQIRSSVLQAASAVFQQGAEKKNTEGVGAGAESQCFGGSEPITA
jgi:hypothetical protein